MTENLYEARFAYDREEVLKRMARRGFDTNMLASVARMNRRTVERIVGLYDPPGMPPERRLQIKGLTAIKLASALRCPVQTICPDMPAKPPKPNPPDHRYIDGPDRLPGGWRDKGQKRDVRQAKWRRVVDELEAS